MKRLYKEGQKPVSSFNRWDVYQGKEHINSVFYLKSYELEEVRSSLINHDGFDSCIEIVKHVEDS